MEISAQLSLSIYHSASSSRNASCDECFSDEDHRQKSACLFRSHRNSSDPEHKLKAQNHRHRRTAGATAYVQLNRRSNHHRISVSSGGTDSFQTLARTLDVDYHFLLLLCSRVHRRKLNWVEVSLANRWNNHRLPLGWSDKFRSSRMASMSEILSHYEFGFVLDTFCQWLHIHLFLCNSKLGRLFAFSTFEVSRAFATDIKTHFAKIYGACLTIQ